LYQKDQDLGSTVLRIFPFHIDTHTPKAFHSSLLTPIPLLARLYPVKLPVESIRHRPYDTETHLPGAKILTFCTTRSIHKHHSYLLPRPNVKRVLVASPHFQRNSQPFTHDAHFPFPALSLSCHPSQRVKHRSPYTHSHDLRTLRFLLPVPPCPLLPSSAVLEFELGICVAFRIERPLPSLPFPSLSDRCPFPFICLSMCKACLGRT
jgi:hypothetical protein